MSSWLGSRSPFALRWAGEHPRGDGVSRRMRRHQRYATNPRPPPAERVTLNPLTPHGVAVSYAGLNARMPERQIVVITWRQLTWRQLTGRQRNGRTRTGNVWGIGSLPPAVRTPAVPPGR